MKVPTTISSTDSRKGTRQPQSMKRSMPTAAVRHQSTPVATIMPMGTPICGKAPNSERRCAGACSTAIRAAPPHSPPAEKPCSTRSPTSSTGAQTPSTA